MSEWRVTSEGCGSVFGGGDGGDDGNVRDTEVPGNDCGNGCALVSNQSNEVLVCTVCNDVGHHALARIVVSEALAVADEVEPNCTDDQNSVSQQCKVVQCQRK